MNRRLYVDVDCLLDTRLGVLSGIDPQAAIAAVRNPRYWTRDYNDWELLTDGLVNKERYDAAWALRDMSTLVDSVVTGIPSVLQQLLVDHHKNMKDGSVVDDVGLEVNLAPYAFTDEERDGLEHILQEMFFSDLIITFCYRPLDELTPTLISEQYSGLVMYEFHDWIKTHHEALVSTPCKDVSFVVPRLFEVNPEELNQEGKQTELTLFRLAMLDHMDVEFISAEWFSMLQAKPTPKPPSR